MNIFFESIGTLLTTPTYLVMMAAFTALGILFGALPGISVNMALILALPLTYSMDTETAMCVLLACYIGAMSGGLISAIMLNIPGTGSSITTTFDGNPMARQGRGGEAMGIGILTSFVGGALSFILLLFVAPLIAKVALRFGPWEYFAIGVFSITMIVSVSGDSVVKGVLASLIGMAFAMTGADPVNGVSRYNFGFHALDGGIPTTALMCGMFAIPEMLKMVMNLDDTSIEVRQMEPLRGFGISLGDYLRRWKTILRAALIGTYVGILPGVGGSSASLLAYLTEKNRSKHPETFGQGEVDGLIASETSNNACVGGAMIPMLALGVPGSSTAAIVLSALTLHGVQCGPLAFSQDADIIYLIFAIMFVANFFMIAIERVMLNGYLRVLTLPRRIIMVMIMMVCFVGAFSARNNYTDVFVFILGGAAGFFLQKIGIGRAPIVMGYILSGIIESNLARALSISRGSFWAISSRPIAMAFIVLAVFSLVSSLYKSQKRARAQKTAS